MKQKQFKKGEYSSMFNRLKSTTSKIAKKFNVKKAAVVTYFTSLAISMNALAAPVPTSSVTVTLGDDVSSDSLIGSAIGVILTFIRGVGVILLIWGFAQLILAFKNEDADSKSRAIMALMVGVALIALKTLLKGMNIISA